MKKKVAQVRKLYDYYNHIYYDGKINVKKNDSKVT